MKLFLECINPISMVMRFEWTHFDSLWTTNWILFSPMIAINLMKKFSYKQIRLKLIFNYYYSIPDDVHQQCVIMNSYVKSDVNLHNVSNVLLNGSHTYVNHSIEIIMHFKSSMFSSIESSKEVQQKVLIKI